MTQLPSVYPGSWGESYPLYTPLCRTYFFGALAFVGHQIRAPSKFRAVPELVTLVVIANLELQLCLKRLSPSKLGFPTLLILEALLALIWESLLITVDAVGRLG